MSNLQQETRLENSSSSKLKIVRITTAVQVMRLAGLQLFIKAQTGIFSNYFAYPFGFGDLFVGLLALPLAYSLRAGGIRKYALAISWNMVGLTDLLFAFTVASYAGLNPTITSNLQTALVIVPVSSILHILTIGLLLTKPLKQVFSQTPP